MRIRILASGIRDLQGGKNFYDRQEPGVGDDFQDCLFADIDSLVLYGGIHRTVFGYHRMLSRRFRYAIYYRVDGDLVVGRRCPEQVPLARSPPGSSEPPHQPRCRSLSTQTAENRGGHPPFSVRKILGPEVDRLPTFEEIGLPGLIKLLQKGEVIFRLRLAGHYLPTACLRLEMRAFSKKRFGRIEFSACRTAGDSPASSRCRSERRAARFCAARRSRLAASKWSCSGGMEAL